MNEPAKREQPENTAGVNEARIIYQWGCHPVKRKPLLSAGVTLLVLLIVAIVYNTTQSVWFALLAVAVFFLSLAKFYFPTHYKFSENGVTIKTTTQTIHKRWQEFRSAYPDKNGILLSPFPEPTRLENFRGLYLMFNNNRDDVIAIVNTHIGRQEDIIQNGAKS